MLYEKCNTCQYSHSAYECKRKIVLADNRTISQQNETGKKEVLGHAIKWHFGKKTEECDQHSEQALSLEDAVSMDKKGVHVNDISFLTDIKDLLGASVKDKTNIAKAYASQIKKDIDSLQNPTLEAIQAIRTKSNLDLLQKLEEKGHFLRK